MPFNDDRNKDVNINSGVSTPISAGGDSIGGLGSSLVSSHVWLMAGGVSSLGGCRCTRFRRICVLSGSTWVSDTPHFPLSWLLQLCLPGLLCLLLGMSVLAC